MNRDRRSVEVAQEICWAMKSNDHNLPDHLLGLTEFGDLTDARRTRHVTQRDLTNAATSIIGNRWRQGSKAVLSVDDDLLSEIVDAMCDEMPGDVFRRIPYESPLIVFPEPLTLTGADGSDQTVLGFFVFATDNQHATSYEYMDTSDPDIEKIGMMFVSRIDTPTGPPIFDYSRTRVVLKDKFRVADAIHETAMQHLTSSALPGTTADNQVKWLTATVAVGLHVLLYLCGPDPDMEEIPKPAVKRLRQAIKNPFLPRTIPVIRVGWQIGPALVAARNQYARTQPDRTGVGRPQGPQHRRGHFRTFWTGKGKSHAVVKFVAPYWTKKELMHLAPNTVHRAV